MKTSKNIINETIMRNCVLLDVLVFMWLSEDALKHALLTSRVKHLLFMCFVVFAVHSSMLPLLITHSCIHPFIDRLECVLFSFVYFLFIGLSLSFSLLE